MTWRGNAAKKASPTMECGSFFRQKPNRMICTNSTGCIPAAQVQQARTMALAHCGHGDCVTTVCSTNKHVSDANEP